MGSDEGSARHLVSWQNARSERSARRRDSKQRAQRESKQRLRIQFVPTPKQKTYMETVFSGDYMFLAYGGAIRGGKTIGVLEILFILCRIFPGSRWAVVRKDLPRIRRNTIPTIEKFAPRPFIGKLNRSEWSYKCENGSEILLLGEQLATDPDLDRFKGLEVNGFVLEEANELSEQTANKCKERLGSWIIQPTRDNPTPAQPPALMLCTFNPADNWVRSWFYDPWLKGTLEAPYHFTKALPTDSPYVTDQQWAAWRELPPEQYKRFVEGDWNATTDPRQLLTYQHIIDAQFVEQKRGRKREGCDVASGGDEETGKHDDTVFALIDGNVIDGRAPFTEAHNGWSEPTIALRARERIRQFSIHPSDYVFDSAPAGAYNILRRWGVETRAFKAGGRPFVRMIQPKSEPVSARDRARGIVRPKPKPVLSAFTFQDLRSQAWYEFADGVKNGEWCILNPTKEMIRDFTAPRYEFKSEFKIKVSSRDEIIEMTGHSPDYGSAVIMGAFKWPAIMHPNVAPTGGYRSLR